MLVLSSSEPITWLCECLSKNCLLVGELGTALANVDWLPDDAAVIELDGFWIYHNVGASQCLRCEMRLAGPSQTPNEVEPEALTALVNVFLVKPQVD